MVSTLSWLYHTYMPKRSNKSIAETLSPTKSPLLDVNYNDKHLALLERKIALATEGFTTHKLCELILR
jgi:hypothetical protein